MPKFQLALDMDDTLCCFLPHVMESAKSIIGRTLKYPKYGDYFGWFPGQVNTDEKAAISKFIYTPEFYLGLPSNFFSMHGLTLQQFSEKVFDIFDDVCIVTARSGALGDKAESVTRQYLVNHKFKNADTLPIHISSPEKSKLSFLNRPTIMVDDSFELAQEFNNHDRHRFVLVDKVWNRGYRGDHNHYRSTTQDLLNTLRVAANSQRPYE